MGFLALFLLAAAMVSLASASEIFRVRTDSSAGESCRAGTAGIPISRVPRRLVAQLMDRLVVADKRRCGAANLQVASLRSEVHLNDDAN